MKQLAPFFAGAALSAAPLLYITPIQDQEEVTEPKLLTEVRELFDTYFFTQEDVSKKDLEYGIVDGFVEAHADRNTQFYPPVDAKDFRESITGDFEGIGAYVDSHELGIYVDRLIAGSPAKEAGILSGDVILTADGEELIDKDIYEAIRFIKGPAGSTVKLEVLRPGEQELLEFDVVRRKIEIPSVEVLSQEGENISVIGLYAFMENTFQSFQNVLEEELAKNPQGIIIDLRDNGGGLLDSAQDILSLFLERGKKIVSIEGKDPNNTEILYSERDGEMVVPLVILINENSASASEIVAGALQDYKLATIVGKTSYGKGSVQLSITLSDTSELKLTTHHWFTPLGRAIEGVGVEPDIDVEYTYEQYQAGQDPQMEAAKKVLLGSQ